MQIKRKNNMRKIIVAMALVVSAVAIQAAQVSWSITNVQDSPSASVAEGWIVQLFASDVVYSYDLAKAGTITATASAYTVENTSTGFMNVSGAKFGDFAAGESYSYYAVIYDATTIDVVVVQILRLYNILYRLNRMIQIVHDDVLVEIIIIDKRK
jgi:hypothetical protein